MFLACHMLLYMSSLLKLKNGFKPEARYRTPTGKSDPEPGGQESWQYPTYPLIPPPKKTLWNAAFLGNFQFKGQLLKISLNKKTNWIFASLKSPVQHHKQCISMGKLWIMLVLQGKYSDTEWHHVKPFPTTMNLKRNYFLLMVLELHHFGGSTGVFILRTGT